MQQSPLKALSNLTRYFFRGEALPAIADVEGVRLKGEEPHATPPRSARKRQDSPRQRLAQEFRGLRDTLSRDPAQADEQMSLFSVSLIRDLPEASPLMNDALSRLRSGDDPSPALDRLAEALDGPPKLVAGPGDWTPMLWPEPAPKTAAEPDMPPEAQP
ncbi:hypothetical protein HOY34_12280 [Xinfangfangia sp. D13-10-4-6]|uniref:hypothetical protein n=1 Tax=Pseudogemmobacter hezensis TaxID=2737662 RepID=UPI001555888F|nr:hypothetical protein [Pseudogemmobacter hezensis]NPD15976.1 hypothetical protein [Pseudogemmobacter hezensis]